MSQLEQRIGSELLAFDAVLREKFKELRPQISDKDLGNPSELLTNDVFKKLFIIDRTVTNPVAFEAGYILWVYLGKDIDQFLNAFQVLPEGEGFKMVPINEDLIAPNNDAESK